MLRNKPAFAYCGLTVILERPSRFDTIKLLSAGGGRVFDDCIKPEFNRHQCDIRIAEDKSPFLPNTKAILLLGSEATKLWLHNLDNSLGEIRGSIYYIQGIPTIASWFPQDAADIKDYESTHNTYQMEGHSTEEGFNSDDEDEEGGMDNKRRHGRTQRKNYKFWLSKDVEHIKAILKKGVPEPEKEPEYIIYPDSKTVIQELDSYRYGTFFFDTETFPAMDFQCVGFSKGLGSPIYVVPFFNTRYEWAYENLPAILRSFAGAIYYNCAIAYNGAAFDFLWLAEKYKIPIGKKVYDPMIAHHRCFPEVEKSLGHAISLWAYNQPFHKDEMAGWSTPEQMKKTMLYCGKDVFTMMLVKRSIDEYARRTPGLTESIAHANAAIRPYLITTLLGIRYDEEKLKEKMAENDALMNQYLRCINLLIGKDTANVLLKRFKSALPSSNPQCCTYFHDLLGYPVISRGKPSKKDGTRKPSLAKKAMFKLRLQFNNPVIDFCIAYRELARESGSLKFTPWRDK